MIAFFIIFILKIARISHHFLTATLFIATDAAMTIVALVLTMIVTGRTLRQNPENVLNCSSQVCLFQPVQGRTRATVQRRDFIRQVKQE
jgi:hypothetical protein